MTFKDTSQDKVFRKEKNESTISRKKRKNVRFLSVEEFVHVALNRMMMDNKLPWCLDSTGHIF